MCDMQDDSKKKTKTANVAEEKSCFSGVSAAVIKFHKINLSGKPSLFL